MIHVAITVVLVVLLYLVPGTVCWLKGKKLWATLGFLTAFHWIPTFRLARPGSWWACRYYSDNKLERARARFPTGDAPRPGRGAS